MMVNRKSIFALALLLSALPFSGKAQNSADMRLYFGETLKKGSTAGVAVPEKKISVSKIGSVRQAVWEAWQQANEAFEEEKLIPLKPIDTANSGKWLLPDSLEPQATLNYYFVSKGEQPSGGYPLFLYLHGSGPRDREWATGLKLAQMFQDAPSLYFIPQIPNEGQWYRWYQRSKQFAWERLLRQVLLRPDVNPDKVYVFGISEGGYGSQRIASFYADYWAAAGPMAGGEPLKNAPAENLRNIGFSLRTGAIDKGFYRNILTGYTADALDSLELLMPEGFRHKVELIPERGHHIDYAPTTPWLRNFTRNAVPHHVNWEDYPMDGRYRTGFYNIAVLKRPAGDGRTYYQMDINRAENKVTLTVDDVTYRTVQRDSIWGIEMKFERDYKPAEQMGFRLYLDETMIDFYRPVTVTVNGRTVFEGKVRPNLNAMLASVATFYDPRRIFPAFIDIE